MASRHLLLFLIVFLPSCNPQQDKKETPAPSVNPRAEADWLFDKRMRCATLREGLDKRHDGGPVYVGQVFYSPIKNSCIYTTRTMVPNTGTFLTITDALTGEGYFEGSTYQNPKMNPEFESRILELKGGKPNDPLGIR
jgi:hypothetical protein